MLQKRNDLDIIEHISEEPKHLRKIAQELHLIPSTVQRTVKKLENEKVLDSITEGKNKKYFLKDTPEAENYKAMSELHKLNKTIQKPQLRRIIKELKTKTNNELIILFGSYASNKETKDSDIDVYIETGDLKLKESLSKISDKLSIKWGKLDKNSLFAKELVKNHVIIQNRERYEQIIKQKDSNNTVYN
jgi:predicted nucleotidyltransferase